MEQRAQLQLLAPPSHQGRLYSQSCGGAEAEAQLQGSGPRRPGHPVLEEGLWKDSPWWLASPNP